MGTEKALCSGLLLIPYPTALYPSMLCSSSCVIPWAFNSLSSTHNIFYLGSVALNFSPHSFLPDFCLLITHLPIEDFSDTPHPHPAGVLGRLWKLRRQNDNALHCSVPSNLSHHVRITFAKTILKFCQVCD